MKNETGGECCTYRRDELGCIQHLVGELQGKSLLGGPRRRWEDNIEMDLQEMGR